MRVVFEDKSALEGVVKDVLGAVGKAMPVLEGILLSVSEGKVHARATDLEREMRSERAFMGDADGPISVVLPAKKLDSILKSLRDDVAVSFSLSDGDERVRITAGSSRFSLASIPADEFPSISDEPDQVFRLPIDVFRDALGRASTAMANGDVRYYLNGVYLACGNGEMVVVATNGHMLCKEVRECDSGISLDGVIVPRESVLQLLRFLQGSDGDIELSVFGDKRLAFSLPDSGRMLGTKLVGGKFPDYDAFIPSTKEAFSLTLDSAVMRGLLSRVGILAGEYRGTRCTIENGVLRLESESQGEQAVDECPVEYKGEGVSTGYNVGYLATALGLGGEIILEYRDSETATLFRYPDSPGSTCLLMPMRL